MHAPLAWIITHWRGGEGTRSVYEFQPYKTGSALAACINDPYFYVVLSCWWSFQYLPSKTGAFWGKPKMQRFYPTDQKHQSPFIASYSNNISFADLCPDSWSLVCLYILNLNIYCLPWPTKAYPEAILCSVSNYALRELGPISYHFLRHQSVYHRTKASLVILHWLSRRLWTALFIREKVFFDRHLQVTSITYDSAILLL